MEVPILSMQAVRQTALPQTSKAPSAPPFSQHLQLQADILEHLQGVPCDTVSIAPNILSEMASSPAAYTRYMEMIDEYVRAYKQYACPGVVSMSFSINKEGVNCIRGVNEVLKRLCLGDGVSEDEDKAAAVSGGASSRFSGFMADAAALPYHLAGALAYREVRHAAVL